MPRYLIESLHAPEGCLPCALRYSPRRRRSTMTSLVVGTILVASARDTLTTKRSGTLPTVHLRSLASVAPLLGSGW